MVHTIDLAGKNVLITGGGRGLGVDIARTFAKAGANLVLTYNGTPADKLAADLAKEFGVKVLSYKVPAGDTAAIDGAVASITQDLGELDVVICNAGICIHVDSAACTDDQFRSTFETNTFFPYFLARAVYNSWFPDGPKEGEKKGKSILFVSSMSGLVSNIPQQQCAYNASKAALTHLGKSLAGDWAPQGVRVNVLSPGYIATEMSSGSEAGKKLGAEWQRRTPMDRFAEPVEIANCLLFLASDMSTFMTGSDMVADGGYTIF